MRRLLGNLRGCAGLFGRKGPSRPVRRRMFIGAAPCTMTGGLGLGLGLWSHSLHSTQPTAACESQIREGSIRLVVTDLDGTLFNKDSRVSPTNLGVLRAVIGPDCPLVVATARAVTENVPFQDLPRPLYLVCLGGAHCMRYAQQPGRLSPLQELFVTSLPQASARAVVEAGEAEGATICVAQVDKLMLKTGPSGANTQFAEEAITRTTSLEEALAEDRTVEVCLCMEGADALAVRLQERLEKAGLAENVDILSWDPEPMISVKSSGVNKAVALQYLCDMLGVDPKSVVAFGDGGNDVEMLQLSGLGVAMANAGAKAKAAADQVSKWSNDEDAVAKELLRLRAQGKL